MQIPENGIMLESECMLDGMRTGIGDFPRGPEPGPQMPKRKRLEIV